MNKNLKKFSLLSILTLSIAIGSVGCQSSPKKISPNDTIPRNTDGIDARDRNDQDTDRYIYRNPNQVPNDANPDNNNLDTNNNSMVERSDRIANKLKELNEVKSATVIITGNTALVGVNIANNVEGKVTTDLKNKVESKVREVDKNIDNVVVTADPDLIKRVERLGSDIKGGKPLSGLGNEIEEIIRRVTPNM